MTSTLANPLAMWLKWLVRVLRQQWCVVRVSVLSYFSEKTIDCVLESSDSSDSSDSGSSSGESSSESEDESEVKKPPITNGPQKAPNTNTTTESSKVEQLNNNPSSVKASDKPTPGPGPNTATITTTTTESLLTPPQVKAEKSPETPVKDEKGPMDGWKFSPTKKKKSPETGTNDQKFDAYKNLAESKKKRDMLLMEEKAPSPAAGTNKFFRRKN